MTNADNNPFAYKLQTGGVERRDVGNIRLSIKTEHGRYVVQANIIKTGRRIYRKEFGSMKSALECYDADPAKSAGLYTKADLKALSVHLTNFPR